MSVPGITDPSTGRAAETPGSGARSSPLESRRLDERLRALADAATAVLATRTHLALSDTLGDVCARLLAFDSFALELYDARTDSLEPVRRNDAGEERADRVPLADSLADTAIRERRTVITRSGGHLAAGGHVVAAGSIICSPIRQDAETLGVLTIHSATAHYDSDDAAVIDAAAALASMVLANLRAREAIRTAESALRDSEAFSRLLQQVTSAANEALTFEEAAGACLTAICSHTGWPTAHVFVRHADGSLVSTGIWELRDAPHYREFTAATARIRYEHGMGTVGRVVAAKEPVWIEDVTHDPVFLRATGDEVRGSFAFPVMVGAEVAGILEFFAREPIRPDAALVELARQIGVQLGRVIERERAERQIRFQARLLDSVGEAVIASDLSHRVVYWNQAAEALFGWTREQAIGLTDSEVMNARADAGQTAEITTRLAAGQAWSGEFVVRRRDGTAIPVRVTGAVMYDPSGTPSGYVGVAADLRESKELEQQLRQAQKMEAVGRLAGGVAHDFNNLLTSIKGITHLLLEDLEAAAPIRADIEEIQRAADRAAALTSQLLAFSRGQVLQPRVVDLNGVVRDMEKMLRRLIGEDVELVTELEPGLAAVRVDATQIGQVLLNLAVNARDAMPTGGCLTVLIRFLELTRTDVRRYANEIRPGRYVALSVRDTGPGIGVQELEHIFEPFYTTKKPGTGTGLGLSTVYGIVKQSDGYVWADSHPDGATFHVLLPRVDAAPERPPEVTTTEPGAGTETLLLVEDEESVRKLARKILMRQGYKVLEAGNGIEALEICRSHDGPIDLVVSDVVMPLMSGAELMHRLDAERPGIPVLLMSGYTGDAMLRHGVATSMEWFLEKPFTPVNLTRKVREVLDTHAARSGGPNASADD